MSSADLKTIEIRARNAEQRLRDATSSKAAFAASIKSADLYMQALKLADNATDRSRLQAKCKELLDRSEQLKNESPRDGPSGPDVSNGNSMSGSSGPDREEPLSKRALTTREKIILVEGSKLNGFKFPIWDYAPRTPEFELKDGNEQFVDSTQLPLSELQLQSFGGWKRPKDALAGIEILRDGQKLSNEPTMRRTERVDLVQDMTSDCSVVASLCAGTSRAERGHSKVHHHVTEAVEY